MSAQGLFTALFNAAIAVAIIATVCSLGLAFTVAQVVAPLRRWGYVAVMVGVNCALIPAVAWGVFKAFGLNDASVAGATLAAIGAAGSSGLKAAQFAKRADLPLAVSLVVVLQLANLVAVPLWAGAVVSGASISGWTILENLLLLVLVPLAAGLTVRARYAELASRWQPGLVRVSNLALGVGLVLGLGVNWHTIVSLLGSRVLVASVIVTVVAVAGGYLVAAGGEPPVRTSGAIVSGMRFGSLGLIVVGTQLGASAAYLGPAIVFALVNLLVVMIPAVELGRRASSPVAEPAPAVRGLAKA